MAEDPQTDTLQRDVEQLREDFKAFRKNLKSHSDREVRSNLNATRNRVSSEIGSRPYTSLLVALGTGLLLGTVAGWASRHTTRGASPAELP